MIPNIFHFIFGLEKDFGNKHFSICHYLAIKSALVVNSPDHIFLYYKYEPCGYWWNKIIDEKLVTLIPVSTPRQIFGNKLYHYAHKADVLRLLVLLKFGGIYLDIDTICIKPLKALLSYDFVMGRENYINSEYGLCNAVILSSKNNQFLQYWFSTYKYFRSKGRDTYWSEHSVKVPNQISKLHPGLIQIEDEESFFWPSYSENNLRLLFEECHSFPKAYLFHLWETVSFEKYLSTMTKDFILENDTTYNIIARAFLND